MTKFFTKNGNPNPTTKTKPAIHKKKFTLDNKRMSPEPYERKTLKDEPIIEY